MMRVLALLLALIYTAPAFAQMGVPQYSIPVSRGAGGGSFGALGPCLNNVPILGAGASTNPNCGPSALAGMAYQAPSAVAITGGAVACVNAPVSGTDCVNKTYADNLAAGLIVLGSSRLATAAVLPNTPTYANGALGVGATLTAGSNTTLTVDGTVAALNDVILVKNQASALQNGIYVVTTAGSGGAAWVLTRATYFDQAAEMLRNSYTFISAGSTNINSSWILAATITTVGTDALNWNQFASAPVVPTTRPVLSGDTIFNVASGGVDSGSCIAGLSGVCATLQYAYNQALKYDANNHNVTFQITSPLSTAGPLNATQAIVGVLNNAVTIQGDPTTPANVLVTANNNTALSFSAPMTFNLNGLKLTTTGTAFTGHAISIQRMATVNFQNIDFGTVTFNHVDNAGGAQVCAGPFTISGNAQEHDHVYNYGTTFGGCATTLTGTPAFSAYFAGNGGGFMSYSGATYTGSATGQKYATHFNGVINTLNETVVLPGTSPGQYIGGNSNDNIGALNLLAQTTLYWSAVTGGGQASWDGANVRMSAGSHNFVIQNPFLYSGGGGSCTPGSVC